MKCIENNKTKTIKRVADTQASVLVATGEYRYTNKSEWRNSVKKFVGNATSQPQPF